MEGAAGKETSSYGKAEGQNVVVEKKEYPDPLASHEDVVKNPIVFWNTLRRFHSIMGTKNPVIGGKKLDLHVLYVEATKMGGYEKVVAEKKWREVGSVFRFSPRTTNASFLLRKHYFSLLNHYEQVHFFKMKGPLLTPTDLKIFPYNDKRSPRSTIEVTGTIDGKFDCGYLISLRLGPEVLRGVLYHPEQPDYSAPTPEYTNALVPYERHS